jgi:hypothetical protein
MFLLDTNVVSELRRARRTDPNVAAWAESVPQEDMFLSSVTILELEMGALRLARRDGGGGRSSGGFKTVCCRLLPTASWWSILTWRGDARICMFQNPVRTGTR